MSDISGETLAGAAGVAVNPRMQPPRGGFVKRCAHYAGWSAWWMVRRVPFFALIFLGFVLLKLSVADLNQTFYVGAHYAFTWEEALLTVAGLLALLELLRVSVPGFDNTVECFYMLGAFGVFFAVYLLSTADVPRMQIFRNTDLVILMLFSGVQVIVAFVVNARTLKRTIDNTGSDHHH